MADYRLDGRSPKSAMRFDPDIDPPPPKESSVTWTGLNQPNDPLRCRLFMTQQHEGCNAKSWSMPRHGNKWA